MTNKPLGLGITLYVLSSVLTLVVFPFAMLFGVFRSLYKRQFVSGLKAIDYKFYTLAIAKDQTGNVVCKELFNDLLISSDSKDQFGNEDETISSVLGKNEEGGNLKVTGRLLANILNKIQKNHCINSINQ